MNSSRRSILASALGAGSVTAASLLVSEGSAEAAAVPSSETGVDWLNVMDAPFNAAGNGTTDDTAAIQGALNAAPLGGVVYLPAGAYATSKALVIPPQVTLRGSHGSHTDTTVCAIVPLAGFTVTQTTGDNGLSVSGDAVIQLLDMSIAGYGEQSTQQGIFDVTIDAGAVPATTVLDGIQAVGYVHGVILQDVQIRNVAGQGIHTLDITEPSADSNQAGFAYSWRGTRVVVNTSGSHGFSLSGMTDCTWIDCEAINCGGSGFNVAAQPSNSQLIGCRAEYSGLNGFTFSGTWTGGGAAGGCLVVSCTTDGNNHNGISVTAAGDSPLTIVGYYGRRDGANFTAGQNSGLGGGGYAGLNCSGSTIPVIVDNLTVIPGVAHSGGTNSPEYGVSLNSGASTVSIAGGLVHGNSLGWYDDGTNLAILRGANVIERAGGTTPLNAGSNPTGYTTSFNGLQVSASALDMGGHALGVPTPYDHGLVAWSLDPALVGGSSSDSIAEGEIYMAAVYVTRTASVSTVYWGVYTPAVGATASQNHVMLINASGTVVASASIDSAVAAAGTQATKLSSAVTVTPGLYWVGILQNAATSPAKLYRSSNVNGTIINMGISNAAVKRFVTNGTGLTSAPSSITPSSNSTSQYALLVGIG